MTKKVRIARAMVASTVLALAAIGLSGAPAQAGMPDDACVLNPSRSQSSFNEARSCFSVGAKMSRALAVKEQATLTFTVTAAATRAGVKVSAELPPNLRWVTRPAGTSQSSRLSLAPHRQGSIPPPRAQALHASPNARASQMRSSPHPRRSIRARWRQYPAPRVLRV